MRFGSKPRELGVKGATNGGASPASEVPDDKLSREHLRVGVASLFGNAIEQYDRHHPMSIFLFAISAIAFINVWLMRVGQKVDLKDVTRT
jgi:hypothetical protein